MKKLTEQQVYTCWQIDIAICFAGLYVYDLQLANISPPLLKCFYYTAVSACMLEKYMWGL
jgi:hypothetical protein